MLAAIHEAGSIGRQQTAVWPRDESVRNVLPNWQLAPKPSVDLIKSGGLAEQRHGTQFSRENYELEGGIEIPSH